MDIFQRHLGLADAAETLQDRRGTGRVVHTELFPEPGQVFFSAGEMGVTSGRLKIRGWRPG